MLQSTPPEYDYTDRRLGYSHKIAYTIAGVETIIVSLAVGWKLYNWLNSLSLLDVANCAISILPIVFGLFIGFGILGEIAKHISD